MLRHFFCKTPIALRQLMKDKTRLAIAMAGIAFANILIFAQMGFEASLFNSSTAPHRSLNADLVVVNRHFESVYSVKNFSRRRLHQVLGFEGVESVSPLYIGLGSWKNPQTHRTQTILVLGTDPRTTAFKFPQINQNISELQKPDTVLFDQASLPAFGPIASLFEQQSRVETELNGIKIRVGGLFSLGASFAAYGNVITSDTTFLSLFPYTPITQIQVGLIKLKSNADIKQVSENLETGLPDDVMIFTASDFETAEKTYWQKSTPIGFIFGLGVIVSFIVGIMVVYQIMYSDVANHLPQYATLKAMGYRDRYLVGVLLQESLILAILGYIPGFTMTLGIYQLASESTMLPIFMTPQRSIAVFVLTVIMCLISGTTAIKKLQSANPADIF
ncbi:FtsX-like permease family protein [Plectonema cf. radiosum LEGE 06105]|uniref:FtsX-like permease family protein n=1 Tax=Plectonema cf. radiosum LEGE 06105 TaxID=945769 RepID=A0A8J7F7C6_9CYAN|nr:ABC transporter permease DevC [Plectonema radiosum]MBE9215420.1 FtsX-like permease family protein [Plectonema cf. radiosum LEGE 06105]